MILSDIFLNPSSIFFVPYLLSSILLTLIWLRFAEGKGLFDSLRLLFNSKSWWGREATIDAAFSLFMLLVLLKWIRPIQEWVFVQVSQLEKNQPLITSTCGPVVESVLATVVAMLAYDLGTYVMHRLMHHSPWLWRIHSFHHSAPRLNFFTTYRQHPLEPLLLATARASFSALGLVIFHLFFPLHAEVVTVWGLGAGFFIYMFTVNLHHSPIPVRYPRLIRKILISPHVHHIHHSVEPHHADRNFGVVFSIWDLVFKTYHDEEVGLNQLSFASSAPKSTITNRRRHRWFSAFPFPFS